MKLKRIKVPKYRFHDELGEFLLENVEILLPVESTACADTFDQERDEYSTSSKEIDRMGKLAAKRFLEENYGKVLAGKHELTPKEVNGIRLSLGCNGSELAELLSLDKSSVSRILKGGQLLQDDTMILLMEKLKNELDAPGSTRALLNRIASDGEEQTVQKLGIPVMDVAQWFIWRFEKLENAITHLKLQKLLYYAQGIALGRHDSTLYNESLLAWAHGPVVREVWDTYTCNRDQPLSFASNGKPNLEKQNPLAVEILEETFAKYGKYGAWYLRDQTHDEAPWRETERNQEISLELMKSYFTNQL